MITPSRLTLTPHQGALASTSTYTGEQTIEETDAQYWQAEAIWENLAPSEAGALIAELLDTETVPFGVPMTRLGNPSGSPQLDGAQSGETVQTTGWDADVTGLLMPGEYVQVGSRLHHVQEQVNSDGSGNAEMVVWPPVEAADNAAIVYDDPEGTWTVGNPEERHTGANQYSVTVTLEEDR